MSNEMEHSAVEGIEVMTKFAQELYTRGLKDGFKYSAIGILVGGAIMIAIECAMDERKKKSTK